MSVYIDHNVGQGYSHVEAVKNIPDLAEVLLPQLHDDDDIEVRLTQVHHDEEQFGSQHHKIIASSVPKRHTSKQWLLKNPACNGTSPRGNVTQCTAAMYIKWQYLKVRALLHSKKGLHLLSYKTGIRIIICNLV